MVQAPRQGHRWLTDLEVKVVRGEAAYRAARQLQVNGFTPEVIVAHPGWGESLFLQGLNVTSPIDLPALRRGRSELRQQMAASGLSDLDCYAGRFQGLLRRIWRHHCNGDPGRLLAAENGTPLSAEP